jgi:hypothetical protein
LVSVIAKAVSAGEPRGPMMRSMWADLVAVADERLADHHAIDLLRHVASPGDLCCTG